MSKSAISLINLFCFPGILSIHYGGSDDRGGECAGGLPVQDTVQAQHQQERRWEYYCTKIIIIWKAVLVKM